MLCISGTSSEYCQQTSIIIEIDTEKLTNKKGYQTCIVHVDVSGNDNDYWASKASPTLGCSIEILHDINIYICRYTCLPYAKMRRRNYVVQTSACLTPVLLIFTFL